MWWTNNSNHMVPDYGRQVATWKLSLKQTEYGKDILARWSCVCPKPVFQSKIQNLEKFLLEHFRTHQCVL